jgi:NADH dehydrogenase FAD-containing subunit
MGAFRTRVVIAGAGVDLARKEVETDRGRLPYDYLVLAAGAVNNYFGHSEIAERSLGLNDLPEALHLRDTILAQFEAAAGDRSIPAGRVEGGRSVIFADASAVQGSAP